MKIDFESEFLDYILKRGYEYYIDNKVSNVLVNDGFVSATVNGNHNYKVNLKIEDDIFIDGECNCPYFKSNGYCKHMAAVLYYLSENKECKTNNYNLEDIISKIDEKKIKKFLYESIINDADLFNRFRVQFNNYFPKLSKENYRNKIYDAISRCSDGRGFIDYDSTSDYEDIMCEFTSEAEKLVDSKDYETAFIIASTILDSIPNTDIDDSNGSTGMVANNCIEIIFDILDNIQAQDNPLLKNILDYVIQEVKTNNLYNYGIDLSQILKYFIDEQLYLSKIMIDLEKALDASSDNDYFSRRKDYVEYLIQIYEFVKDKRNVLRVLEKYSFDSNILLRYVDELIKNDNLKDAIKILKEKLNDKDYNGRSLAKKLADMYLKNNMMEEYKDILYEIFYKFDKYDMDIYRKIKGLYSSKDWKIEKENIIENIKKDKYIDRYLNDIFIEEKMTKELYLNVCDYGMDYVKAYEQYLLPKYNDKLLNIYKKSCLHDAQCANNRNRYRELAMNVNHIIGMDNSQEVVKLILEEIKEKYFRNKPAMLDEFKNIISIYNMNDKEKFKGFLDTNIEEGQERLVNRDKKYKVKRDVKKDESLWDYIKRKEIEESLKYK